MIVESVRALEALVAPQEVVDGTHGGHGDVVVAEMVVVVVFGAFRVAVQHDGFDGGGLGRVVLFGGGLRRRRGRLVVAGGGRGVGGDRRGCPRHIYDTG